MRRSSTALFAALGLLANLGCAGGSTKKPDAGAPDAGARAQIDEWAQITEVTPVDILFLVDNSGSMEEEQSNVAANFASFIDKIVKINDQEQPTGWVYNCPEGTGEFRFGSVSFDPDASPGVGSTVQIIYEPAQTPPTACGARPGATSCAAPQVCGNCGYCEASR
jgi:hypothetical protein